MIKRDLRLAYNLLWIFILPFALLRLLWRARKNRTYLLHLAERLGFSPHLPTGIWVQVHAVSVGETRAAQPLIEALLAYSPKTHILLTHMTLTGYQTGTHIFAQQITQQRLRQTYLPYDLPCFIERFIRHTQPTLSILIETEIWPNLIFCLKKHAIPVILANARMSSRSFRKAAHLGQTARTVFNALSAVTAQSKMDAKRLRKLGAQHICITGNLKFDTQAETELIHRGLILRQTIGLHRPVLCAASTREGEEALILKAWKKCQEKHPEFSSALLLLVPRHPERCPKIADILDAQGFTFTKRSALIKDWSNLDQQTQVILGDSLGEMSMYYTASDVALVGGSLLPFGGQNLIEASALGKPVLFGPYMFNFTQASEAALMHGAAIQIFDENDLSKKIASLLQDKTMQTKMALAATEFANTYRGATANTMKILQRFLDEKLN